MSVVGSWTTRVSVVVAAFFGLFAASVASAAPHDEATRLVRDYIPVHAPSAVTVGVDPIAGGAPRVLFLNRCVGGLSLSPGLEDSSQANVSSILEGPATLPAFPHGDAAWNEVVAHTRELFAPFNVTITDIDPGAAPHDEATVCGTAADAGFAEDYAGVAPATCAVIPNAITFTFPAAIGNYPRDIAETIAQEAAHAWGLDHSYKCEDPMTYLFDCGQKSFQNGDYPCGEYEARACSCGGNTQNTVQYILQAFGPPPADTEPPETAIVSPADGDMFDFGEVFTIDLDVDDDRGVVSVSLFVDGVMQALDDTEPFGGWPVIDLPPGIYALHVESIDIGGNVGVSDAVTIEITGTDAPDAEPSGDDTDETGGGSGGDDADASADAGDDGTIPAPWGLAQPQETSGCTIGTGPRPPWVALLLLIAASLRRRRR